MVFSSSKFAFFLYSTWKERWQVSQTFYSFMVRGICGVFPKIKIKRCMVLHLSKLCYVCTTHTHKKRQDADYACYINFFHFTTPLPLTSLVRVLIIIVHFYRLSLAYDCGLLGNHHWLDSFIFHPINRLL